MLSRRAADGSGARTVGRTARWPKVVGGSNALSASRRSPRPRARCSTVPPDTAGLAVRKYVVGRDLEESEFVGMHQVYDLTVRITPNFVPRPTAPVGARHRLSRSAWQRAPRSEARRPVLFFSLEMGHLELTRAARSRLGTKLRTSGGSSESDWSKMGPCAMGASAKAPLLIEGKAPDVHGHGDAGRRPRRLRRAHVGDLGSGHHRAAFQLMSRPRRRREGRQVEVSE